MGYSKNVKLDKNDSSAIKRAQRRQERQQRRVKFPVETIFCPELQYCITAILDAGGAVRFGLTRDGGALAIGIYGDGDAPRTEYLRPDEDCASYLADLGDYFQEVSDGPKDSGKADGGDETAGVRRNGR